MTTPNQGADTAVRRKQRAADGLCEVTLVIEAVDYNALREEDLAALMDAWQTINEMTLAYRRDQHSIERAEERDRGRASDHAHVHRVGGARRVR